MGIRPKLAVMFGLALARGSESLRGARQLLERMLAEADAHDDTLLQVIGPSFLVIQTWCAELVTPEAAMRYAASARERAEAAVKPRRKDLG